MANFIEFDYHTLLRQPSGKFMTLYISGRGDIDGNGVNVKASKCPQGENVLDIIEFMNNEMYQDIMVEAEVKFNVFASDMRKELGE